MKQLEAAAQASNQLTKAKYKLYYYVPTIPSGNGGSVIKVGKSPGFVFFDNLLPSYNSMAHELGHSLGLRHPSDPASKKQYAGHLRKSVNKATAAGAETHTEPAHSAETANTNIMARDPLNLMGYWLNKPIRTQLRYHQWKSISRN
jgi:hypothetical protein